MNVTKEVKIHQVSSIVSSPEKLDKKYTGGRKREWD